MSGYFDFFLRVAKRDPLPYQERIAENSAQHTAIIIPTGLGKTHAVLCDWLYRLPTTRLAWVLPGRALAKQVADEARHLVEEAGLKIVVVELMGGSETLDITLKPDQAAILVGTQDILVSRALNRGYARSPFRWPIDFGLLNSDTQWVFDEVQLLGDSLATSTQLAAFREGFGVFGKCPTAWLSATFNTEWLNTVNFRGREIRVIELEERDKNNEVVQQRIYAPKTIVPAPESCRSPKGCAEFVVRNHIEGELSLVIANTVERATEISDAIPKDAGAVLLHSRFRPGERRKQLEKALSGKGIVVATQVIEAGIDIDAALLVTDIAPWPSLVQRFGRVNRKGARAESNIYWVDGPLRGKKDIALTETMSEKDQEFLALPYAPSQIIQARRALWNLTGASPEELRKQNIETEAPYRFVLRKADLLDLFDTTPDLAGNHIDISRFVRSGEETNVYAAWASWGKEGPPENLNPLSDEELCPVPFGEDLNGLIERSKDKGGAWVWNYTEEGRWEKLADPRKLYAGAVVLFPSDLGGYENDRGYAPKSTKRVEAVAPAVDTRAPDAQGADPMSFGDYRQGLEEHSTDVWQAMRTLLSKLGSDLEGFRDDLETAAKLHDWGKAHPVFQSTLHGSGVALLAKQRRADSERRHGRKGFRHELASALAMLETGESNLATYLVAAHHGKVRMNIRSLPGETDEGKTRSSRGIRDGDALFAARLGDGVAVNGVELRLAATEIGLADEKLGWSDRTDALLRDLGPFRLAYLEALLRSADETASAEAGKRLAGGNK